MDFNLRPTALQQDSREQSGQHRAAKRSQVVLWHRTETIMPKTRKNNLRESSSCRRRRSRTSRAELTFAVSLVEHHLREGGHARRFSETVPIFLTAILEFLTRRLLELAGNEAQRRGTEMRITPELLDLAVYSNSLLSELFQFITISQVAPPHH